MPRIAKEEVEALFAILESESLQRLVQQRNREVTLVEARRAHSICLLLAGVKGVDAGVGGGAQRHTASACC